MALPRPRPPVAESLSWVQDKARERPPGRDDLRGERDDLLTSRFGTFAFRHGDDRMTPSWTAAQKIEDTHRRTTTTVAGDCTSPPLAAAHRIVVRRTTSGTAGLPWHQDGQFFGEARGVNVWTALDDCGLQCPSLNFVPRRLDDVIAPGRMGLGADPVIESAVAELLADRPVAEPVLRAGDAVIFDEMTVHRTGTRSWSTPHRDLAITWFFAPSRFPDGPTPLAF